jgi:endonuclease-3
LKRFEKHIFVCENVRPADNPHGCCSDKGSKELRQLFKIRLKELGLKNEVRANAAGCLDACEYGASVVVYPDYLSGITDLTKMPDKKEKERANQILERLRNAYPDVKSAIESESPFEMLIATILSAQCTDERVNIVTEDLFKKYKSPEDYLKVSNAELEKDIFSTGFYRQKARSIKLTCQKLLDEYDGEVPVDFDELTKLPGVGRKTASVVAGNAFGLPAIAVDTHVRRLSNLLGFISSNNVDKIEERLKELFPKKDWVNSSHWLATHGRITCIVRRPKCDECFLSDLCPGFQSVKN